MLLVVGAAGCGSDAEPVASCVASLDTACTPQYEPTFDNVFDRTLSKSCALAGGACHSAEGSPSGLVLDTADTAYEHLLGQNGAPARVIAGDAACSTLMVRLEADASQAMPPGSPLDATARCAIQRWIDEGAAR